MRRMISQKLQDFIKKLFGHIDQNGNTTEVGADLEVDGNIKVNGVENLTDKDGQPLDFGGGGSAAIVDTEEIVHIEGEEGTELYLAQEVSNKVQNSLQLPVSPPLTDALVGVGTNGAQKQIGVGDGLKVENGVLKADIEVPKIITLSSKFFIEASSVAVTDEEIALFVDNIIGVKSSDGLYHGVLLYSKVDTYIEMVYGFPYDSYIDASDCIKIIINISNKTMEVVLSST